MERKMFGHRAKRKSNSERVPGEPYNDAGYDHGDEDKESYTYVKNKDFPAKGKGIHSEPSKGNPPGYEGKEHVKYRDPGHTRHKIRFPQDEPHMKSNVSKNEMHEMEDNYHMAVPDQTEYTLQEKLKRARMKMDAPDQEDPKPLRGNMVQNTPAKGEEDTSGEEEMGPHDMQGGMSKEHRKKMIVAITRRKMMKEKK
jgi:hypothetical protein